MKKRIVPILTALVFVVFVLLGFLAVHQSPPVKLLDALVISPDITGTVELGAQDLGQTPGVYSADRKHLAVRMHNGKWWLANISASKKVDVNTDKRDTLFIRRILLRQGDRIVLNRHLLEVSTATPDSLVLTDLLPGKTAEWRNGRLAAAGQLNLKEEQERADRLTEDWKERTGNDELFLFALGGSVSLYNQWGLADVAKRGAWITWDGSGFSIAPGSEHLVAVEDGAGGSRRTFSSQWLPVEGPWGTVRRIVLGRTYYEVSRDGQGLALRPFLKVQGLDPSAPEPPLQPGLTRTFTERTWIGGGPDPLQWLDRMSSTSPVHLVLLLLVPAVWTALLLAFRYLMRPPFPLPRNPVPLTLWVSPLVVLFLGVLDRGGNSFDLSWALAACLLIWLWATLSLVANKRFNRLTAGLWCCALFLAGSGVLVHLQLCAGTDNTRWAGYLAKQIFGISSCGFSVGMAAHVSVSRLRSVIMKVTSAFWEDKKWSRWSQGILYGVGFLLVIWLGLKGNEQGLGVFQPSEITKLLAVMLSGFLMNEIYIRRSPLIQDSAAVPFWRQLKSLGWSALISMILLGLGNIVFYTIDDISPMLILLVFSLGWLARVAVIPYTNMPEWDRKKNRLLLAWVGLLAVFMVLPMWAMHAHFAHAGSKQMREIGDLGLAPFLPMLLLLMSSFVWVLSQICWEFFKMSDRGTWSRLGAMLGLAAVPVLLTAAFWYFFGDDISAKSIPQWERFAVWSDPEKYLVSGGQVLRGLEMIRAGGWTGVFPSWFGGNGSGNVLPAVQDDFILSFLLYKFGQLAGVVLLIVQLCYLGFLVLIGRKGLAWAFDEKPGEEDRWAAIVLTTILYGMTVIHALQWGISWCNVFGLLPVMGQPMTWLSAGNSHLLSIGLPTLLFAFVCSWVLSQDTSVQQSNSL